MILQGARTAVTDQRPTASSMPSYDWKLGDTEVAAVATYVRNAWGNPRQPSPPMQSNPCVKLSRQPRHEA